MLFMRSTPEHDDTENTEMEKHAGKNEAQENLVLHY